MFVFLKDRPDFPSNPPHVERKGQLIYLTWEKARQRTNHSMWYTVEMLRLDESYQWFKIKTDVSTNFVTLEDNFPAEDCSFRVFAENEAGKTSPTLPAILKKHGGKLFALR